MAKMYGLNGRISGKMGNTVFRVRGGEQIATQYNPIVSNPNSKGQQDTRTAFKLMSVMAAVLAPEIVMKRVGGSLPRNRFAKANWPLIEVDDVGQEVEASLLVANLQLTDGQLSMSSLKVSSEGNAINVSLVAGQEQNFDAVRWVAVEVPVSGRVGTLGVTNRPARIRATKTTVNATPGAASDFSDTLAVGFDPAEVGMVILAYGIVNRETARTRYENAAGDGESGEISLTSGRTAAKSGIIYSTTAGALVPAL